MLRKQIIRVVLRSIATTGYVTSIQKLNVLGIGWINAFVNQLNWIGEVFIKIITILLISEINFQACLIKK